MHTDMPSRLALFAAALWWGSLTAVGFIVVPLLFAHLPTPAMAGNMAARLFTAQTWLSVGCGVAVLLVERGRMAAQARPRSAAGASVTTLGFVFAGLLLALLIEFAVAPHIRARDNLRLWHGVGTGMHVLQWLCAAVVLWRCGTVARKVQ